MERPMNPKRITGKSPAGFDERDITGYGSTERKQVSNPLEDYTTEQLKDELHRRGIKA